jgi:hypothetical protein
MGGTKDRVRGTQYSAMSTSSPDRCVIVLSSNRPVAFRVIRSRKYLAHAIVVELAISGRFATNFETRQSFSG